MLIILPAAPDNALDVVRRTAPAALAIAPADSRMRAASESMSQLNVTMPHRVFSASLDDVLSGRVLVNARETAWRYFLIHGEDEPFAGLACHGAR